MPNRNALDRKPVTQQPEDIHLGETGLLHKLIRRRKLDGVFLFITSQCNSKCRTCFYHERVNGKDDLTFDQMRKLSETAPKFDKLWLSGGEPFLREELVEIIKLFHDNNGVKVINLPTNGLLTDRIERLTGRLLEECPKLTIHLNFSLDGLGRMHDSVRGIPGNFTKTIASMERIKRAYGGHPRLLVNVATVVTPDAIGQMTELGAYLLKKDMVATHFFEVARGNTRDPKIKNLTDDQIRDLRARILPLLDAQAESLFKKFSGLKKKIARLFFIGFIRFVNELQDANHAGPSDWGMPCTAGETTIVIDANGDFRSCEMRPPIGNLRDYDYNLNAALFSAAMRREIAEIGGGARANCWCTHGCWIMSSIKFSPRALLVRIPAAYRNAMKQLGAGTPYRIPDIDIDAIENYAGAAKKSARPAAAKPARKPAAKPARKPAPRKKG